MEENEHPALDGEDTIPLCHFRLPFPLAVYANPLPLPLDTLPVLFQLDHALPFEFLPNGTAEFEDKLMLWSRNRHIPRRRAVTLLF